MTRVGQSTTQSIDFWKSNTPATHFDHFDKQVWIFNNLPNSGAGDIQSWLRLQKGFLFWLISNTICYHTKVPNNFPYKCRIFFTKNDLKTSPTCFVYVICPNYRKKLNIWLNDLSLSSVDCHNKWIVSTLLQKNI